MSELIGLSLDQAASPYLSFEDDPANGSADDQRNGWGVAWYPGGDLGAAVVRDPRSGRSGEVTDVLADTGMLETRLLVSHLRGAAKRANYRDTHPFVISFAGRSWVIAHNGDLVGDLNRALPLPEGPALAPIGPTDTEHLFVWLLGRIAEIGASSMAEFGFDAVAGLLAEANELGTLNVLLSDGTSLLAYRCSSGFQPLCHGRFIPPHPGPAPGSGSDGEAEIELGPDPDGGPPVLQLGQAGVTLGLRGPQDRTTSMLVVSTLPFEATFEPLEPGRFTVASGGRILESPRSAGGAQVALAEPASLISRTSASDRRRLDIEHTTVYRYRRPVQRSSHRLRLHPVDDRYQRVTDHRIEVSVEGTRYEYEDVFGNHVLGVEIDTPYEVLTVAMTASVEVRTRIDRPHLLPRAHKLPATWMPWQEHMMHSYLLPPELPESQLHELIEYARSFAARNRGELVGTLDDIAWSIHSDYAYKQGFTTVETTPYEVFRSRAGVCQDFANLMICLARMLNVPARYRVGYISTGADYDNTVQSEASHAWVETYVPDVGWRGYDPTNGTRAGLDHVRVAVGRNYRDATPTSGVIHQGGGDDETLTTEVQVTEG